MRSLIKKLRCWLGLHSPCCVEIDNYGKPSRPMLLCPDCEGVHAP